MNSTDLLFLADYYLLLLLLLFSYYYDLPFIIILFFFVFFNVTSNNYFSSLSINGIYSFNAHINELPLLPYYVAYFIK